MKVKLLLLLVVLFFPPMVLAAEQTTTHLDESMDISLSGILAQKIHLELIASNIANIGTTRTPQGGPYKRKVPIFTAYSKYEVSIKISRTPALLEFIAEHLGKYKYDDNLECLTVFGKMTAIEKEQLLNCFLEIPDKEAVEKLYVLSQTGQIKGVALLGVSEDPTPGKKVYNPGHPDADAEGFVMVPNVDISTEMMDLIFATRLYEANITVFNAAKQLANTTMELGR